MELLKANKRSQKLRRERELEKEIAEKCKLVLKMIEEEKSRGKLPLLPEKEDIKILNDVNKEREELKKARAVLAKEKAKVKQAIARAREITKVHEPASGRGAGRAKRPQTGDLIDCVGCGKPIPHANYSRHQGSCFAKLEHAEVTGLRPSESEDGSQIVHCDYFDRSGKQTYCKKLKASCVRHSGFSSYRAKKKENVLVCGCPLSTGEYCNAPRKTCLKHIDWENIKQANILLLELTHMQTEKQLKFEEKVTGKRMVTRRGLLVDKVDGQQPVHTGSDEPKT